MDTPLPLDKIVKDRYKISRILGQGGQCFVYEVDDLKENRRVVLKELRSNIANPVTYAEDVVMFKKEYEILGRLDHPRLPKSYDYFKEGEDYFLVVQYIKGKNLDVLFKDRGEPYGEEQVVEWGIELSDMLSYLYNIKPHPVVIRDIKPSNIVISDDGGAYLVDFTVARENKISDRGDTVRIGSPGYAPPEQYKGLSDPRSDIYALGVTLYRLLTGINPSQIPFQFEPVRQHNPQVSKKLEYVISKAIELDVEKRYQKPAEMHQHLKYIKDELNGIEHPEFDISDFVPRAQDDTSQVALTGEGKSAGSTLLVLQILVIFIVLGAIISAFFFYKPFMINSYISKGKSLFEKGQYEEAKGTFEKALELSPHNSEAVYYTGTLLIYTDDKDRGEEYLEKSCNDLNLIREKAFYHYEKGKELKDKNFEKSKVEFHIAEFLAGKGKEKFDLPD